MAKPGKLFESLKQGDPRAVAATAALLFLFAVCWFSWTLLTPPAEEPLPMGRDARRAPPPPEETPLGAIIRGQQSLAAAERAPNPFHHEAPERPAPPPRPTRKPENETPRPPPDKGNGDEPKPPPKDPGPKPVRVSYVYKGMLRRPDGEVVALVANPKNGTSRYLREGDELKPLTLESIAPSGLEVRQGDEPLMFMPRGEVRTFEQMPE